jgi:AraC-type DNA-binding domain-containing proteins
MDNLITHYILTFGSSSIILILSFLLLGIRIPKEENLKNLHAGRKYLSFSYFILAASGFLSYFMHVEAESDPVLMASTLFIASYQALLFTATTLIFIQTAIVKKKWVVIQLCVITIIGVALVLSSIFSPNQIFFYLFWTVVVLYLFQLIYYTYLFRREYEKSLKQVEDYYDEEEDKRLQWVKYCFYSALGIGILALCSLFMNTFLYGFFILAYTAYYTYIVCRFYNYITDMSFLAPALSAETNFTEERADEESSKLPEEEKINLSENERQLKAALEQWVENKQYCQKDVGVDDIVQELGTNRDFLRYYFHYYMSSDFRTWRTELRIAEAKSILREHPELSLEEIALMAGFNCRGNFHRQFQKITGETPTEYRNNVKKLD